MEKKRFVGKGEWREVSKRREFGKDGLLSNRFDEIKYKGAG